VTELQEGRDRVFAIGTLENMGMTRKWVLKVVVAEKFV
jgi:hypothetical protein